MQNSDFWIRKTNLYGSQTSPVILCIQSSVISTRITYLYQSQPLSLTFACKTAPFGAELQVCMGPWPHLSFCACKTAWLASELLVSRGPSPHLWFVDAQQRLLTRITNLHGYQPSPVVLWMQISVISIGITSLYWSQPVPVAFACKPAPFGAELQVSIGPRPQL